MNRTLLQFSAILLLIAISVMPDVYGQKSSTATKNASGSLKSGNAIDVNSGLITQFFFNNSIYSEGNTNMFIENVDSQLPVDFESNQDGQAVKINNRMKKIVTKRIVSGNPVIAPLPSGTMLRTVAMRIKPDYVMSNMALFKYGNDAVSQTFGAYIGDTGAGQAKIAFQGYGSGNDFSTPSYYTISGWNHFAITYDGTVVKIYFNGALAGQKNATLNTAITSNFYISAFEGLVDDLKIYDRALDAGEIGYIFNNFEYRVPDDETGDEDAEDACPSLIGKFFFDTYKSENNKDMEVVNTVSSVPLQKTNMAIKNTALTTTTNTWKRIEI